MHAPKFVPRAIAQATNFGGSDAAGDCRNDAHGLAVGNRRLDPLQVTDIFIADVDIDKTAQSALFVVEMPAQLRVLLAQCCQYLTLQNRMQARCWHCRRRTGGVRLEW